MPHGSVTDHATVELKVLRCFELRVDHVVVSVPTNVERLLAYLAVQDCPQPRHHVAGRLWMDTIDARAAASLRTALWRARRTIGDRLVTNGDTLTLSPDLDVDLRQLTRQARNLLRLESELDERDADPTLMRGDLLPDWDEEWIVGERERLRQLRVHALEALCAKLCQAGRTAEAVDVAMMAISAEPLRESAHRLLVAAHVAEGNMSEARRQYDRYRSLLWDDLGIEPSVALRSLIERACPATGRDDRSHVGTRRHGTTTNRPSTETGAAVRFRTSIQ
jgi:DNA-binding SARP family transcriptional activator